jgi:hypothetical protein
MTPAQRFETMTSAPYIIVGDAAAMRQRLSISDPTGYVGFKLVGIMACSVKDAMHTPAIALQYLERLQRLLLELLPAYDCEEVRRMVAKTDELVAALDDVNVDEAVRRLLD